MTQKRYDNHSTEFGLWLRKQSEIDSNRGFITTNIDYLWKNYKTGLWMLIEEKRYMSCPKKWQHGLFRMLNKAINRKDQKYKGFHLIQFEKTNPEDGKIYLNKKEISKEELIKFLRFT